MLLKPAWTPALTCVNHSTAEFPAPAVSSALNVFAGRDVAQAFTLTIDRVARVGVDFSSVSDVLLAIDYSADLT